MAGARRPIRPEDVYRLRGVSDPQISADGEWVAEGSADLEKAAMLRKAQ